MPNQSEVWTPSDVVGTRVREVRKRRGWTAAQLAERCAEFGAAEITSTVVTDLETGRRDKATGRRRRNITVDELLVLAYALDVAPVHLLVPIVDDEYAVTPEHPEGTRAVRAWIRGECGLEGTDMRVFASEVPQHEFGQMTWPETVTYERTQPDGKPERWTVDVGALQDVRLSRKPEWRRVPNEPGNDRGQG